MAKQATSAAMVVGLGGRKQMGECSESTDCTEVVLLVEFLFDNDTALDLIEQLKLCIHQFLRREHR